MNIHEFQTKEILKKYGVPLPDFVVITSADELEKALDQLKIDAAVLKIQVHAGGRGKGGGVKIGKTREELREHAQKLIGMRLVNNQTGPNGIVAHQVLVSPLITYEKEYYLACAIDRKLAQGVLIGSSEGGIEIEEIAKKNPEKVFKLPIPLDGKFRRYELYPFVKALGWTGGTAEMGITLIQNLSKAFVETDASLLEINPLVKTGDGKLLALDAKLSVDDNALFRQPLIRSFYDASQEAPSEVKAHAADLAYIQLEGDIGCMVNGAGLAMATMDIVKGVGGKPANFLDVGGGATKEKVAEGFKIILSDPHVRAILVNIFGGIMNCETIAEGIIQAAQELKLQVPLVVRMEGTHVEEGRKKLKEAHLNLSLANDMKEAAITAVKG